MIRAVLQRPGRLRMRLTVVAAASALFALIVLAALVLPSLQHNLEQSRVDSLRASVLAATPGSPDTPFGSAAQPSDLQDLAATLGRRRGSAVFTRRAASSSGTVRGLLPERARSAESRSSSRRPRPCTATPSTVVQPARAGARPC